MSVPPYHIAGVMNLLSNMYMGRRIVYLDAFDPERVAARVRGQAITHAMVVPTMLARIVAALGGAAAETPSLRTIAYGGAKMPAAVIETALRLFPDVAFINAYGLTETSSTIAVLGPDDHRPASASDDPAVRARLRSAGRPLPGVEIEIRDEDGACSARRHDGDICVRGEQVAGEYVGTDRIAATAGSPTRDSGYLDEDGLRLRRGPGRRHHHPGRREHRPGRDRGSPPGPRRRGRLRGRRHRRTTNGASASRAAVVLVEGAASNPEDIRGYARARLRGSKTPDIIVVLAELPYTDTGKLLRRVVRDDLTRLSVAAES